jgi:hypothetical protein
MVAENRKRIPANLDRGKLSWKALAAGALMSVVTVAFIRPKWLT